MSSDWSKEWKKKHYSTSEKTSQGDPKPLIPSSLESVPTENRPPFATLSSSTEQTSEPMEEEKKDEKPGENTPQPKMTPENLERDYWNIVETQRVDIDVDYGNDVDTSEFGSGFPISDRGRSVNSRNLQAGLSNEELPEPEFGTEEFYKETFWNLVG